ncbi:hypothetical protein HAX54_005498 [Datura stramonium]|uniref:Uncharacterized protein n=1 Tax=Datura stramonium TaxID=4076 RepID=A0ABS8TAH7_DATST|nr:hypothetical protein [Datura stramonium]
MLSEKLLKDQVLPWYVLKGSISSPKAPKGWEHLFSLPMPIMYESEVTEFYASLCFTDDDESVFATIGGIDLEFDSISLGKILNVHTTGEFTSSAVPGALLDLQEQNARSVNASLKNQLEELTRQMICDQRTANERIEKLLAKL